MLFIDFFTLSIYFQLIMIKVCKLDQLHYRTKCLPMAVFKRLIITEENLANSLETV